MQAYEAFSDAIFRHCYFRIFNRERAKELMQETFMRTWKELAGGKSIENLRAFLYRVANNLIIDEARKKKEISLEKMQEEGFDLAGRDRGQAIEAGEALLLARRLDSKYRNAVLMRYIDDFSPKEIAEIVGESENTVSVRIHRGLKQLKEKLSAGGDMGNKN